MHKKVMSMISCSAHSDALKKGTWELLACLDQILNTLQLTRAYEIMSAWIEVVIDDQLYWSAGQTIYADGGRLALNYTCEVKSRS